MSSLQNRPSARRPLTSPWFAIADNTDLFRVDTCPQLQSLSFDLPFGNFFETFPGQWSSAALSSILSQAPPTLQSIEIKLMRMGEAHPSDLADELPAIQRVLEARAFPRLREFVVHVAQWEHVEEYRPVLEQAFPQLCADGVIRLSILVSIYRIAV